MENRNTENSETLKKRLDRVPMELAQGPKFDFQVVNDDLQKAIEEVNTIVQKYFTNNI